MLIDEFLGKFSHVKGDKPNHWMVTCPCHDDKKTSLSITNSNGKILLYCFAGCKISDILNATKLTFSDLFSDDKQPPTAIYQYRNADGSFSHEKLKYKTKDGKRFAQRHIDTNGDIVDNLDGIKRIPYNLPIVLKTIKTGGPLLYVEGEKDAETASLLGYTATTMGGASDWKEEYKNYFKDASLIIVPDKDDPGIKLSEKMIKDLTEIAKSLRVVILPEGKDLTEWVEAGGKDFSKLIETSPDIAKYKGLTQAVALKTASGYSFNWQELNLNIKIDHLTSDLECIITVLDNGRKIHASKINLLAQRSISTLANRLKQSKKIDWEAILSQIVLYCQDATSVGGSIENINAEPLTMETEYLLDPLFPRNQPITIYTAGGKGKSIFADYFALLVQCGLCSDGDLPFVPIQTNVLYLDWESDLETHRRYITAIKRGLATDIKDRIMYIRLESPLVQVIDDIREKVFANNIGFVILDSQMAATASGSRGLTEAQVAGEYYNMIRSFNCTTLTIDHITKQSMSDENGTETPYGSIVKYNRSRSQFELRLPEDDEDEEHKEYVLLHRKFNLGRKMKPLGITVDFENKDNELVKISFGSCSIIDSPSLSGTLKLKQRLINLLKQNQRMSIKDLSEKTGKEQNSIRSELSRNTKIFEKGADDLWHLMF
jgi:hypothetical protein